MVFLILFLSLCSYSVAHDKEIVANNPPIELIEEDAINHVDVPVEQQSEKVVQKKDECEVEEPTENEVLEPESEVFIKEAKQPVKLEVLDCIGAVVATEEQVEIITMQDVDKRGFDGGHYILKDLVNETLLDQLGEKFKINVEDKDVTRYLQKTNMSDEQIKSIAHMWGYPTVEDFYKVFKKMYRASSTLNYKVQSELVFTEDVIQERYQQTLMHQEALYTLETAFIPVAKNQDKEAIYKELCTYAEAKTAIASIVWDAPIDIVASEVPAANDFIFSMKVGDIYVKPVADGFDLFKLKALREERYIPIDERRSDIVNELRSEKYTSAVEKVLEQLHKDACIIYPTFKEYPMPTIFKENC